MKALFKYRMVFTVIISVAAVLSCIHEPQAAQEFYDPQAPVITHPKAAQFQALLDAGVLEGIPGAAMLLSGPEGLWYGSAGSADIALSRDFRPGTVSRIGSVTKLFTAVSVMKFVESGLLSLDDPMGKYVPEEMVMNIDNGPSITLRQLLNHSSGVPGYTDTIEFGTDMLSDPVRVRSMDELISYVYGKSASFPPGEKHKYSNTNYLLLGKVLEKVSGKDAAQVMKDSIFTPLGMQYSEMNPAQPVPSGAARGYTDLYGDGSIVDTTGYAMGGYSDGGISSTVFDLHTFAKAVFEGGFLSEASLSEMRTFIPCPEPEFNLTQYGLGLRYWEMNDMHGIGHTGGSWGYLAELFYVPERQTFLIFLTNGSMGRLSEITDTGIHMALPALVFAGE